MALSKQYRLPLRFERSRINKEGQPYSGKNLTIIVASSGGANSRFAILVSKKISTLATDRNLLRRRISEVIHPLLEKLPTKDYLIIPKKTALVSDQETLKTELMSILNVRKST